MATGAESATYHAASTVWEVKKTAIFISLEILLTIIAVLINIYVIKPRVLGPPDSELREQDRRDKPHLWNTRYDHLRELNVLVNESDRRRGREDSGTTGATGDVSSLPGSPIEAKFKKTWEQKDHAVTYAADSIEMVRQPRRQRSAPSLPQLDLTPQAIAFSERPQPQRKHSEPLLSSAHMSDHPSPRKSLTRLRVHASPALTQMFRHRGTMSGGHIENLVTSTDSTCSALVPNQPRAALPPTAASSIYSARPDTPAEGQEERSSSKVSEDIMAALALSPPFSPYEGSSPGNSEDVPAMPELSPAVTVRKRAASVSANGHKQDLEDAITSSSPVMPKPIGPVSKESIPGRMHFVLPDKVERTHVGAGTSGTSTNGGAKGPVDANGRRGKKSCCAAELERRGIGALVRRTTSEKDEKAVTDDEDEDFVDAQGRQ